MAAAAAMQCKHSPNGAIHWLQVKILVVLRWAMHPASHRHIQMVAIEIVVDLPAFFVTSISLLATIIDK